MGQNTEESGSILGSTACTLDMGMGIMNIAKLKNE
jgi:hypothetical protein